MRGLTILVIDDNPADAGALRRLLAKIDGVEIQLFHELNAESGQARLADGGIDCLLLDYQLGSTNGLDVLKSIRASGDDVPVVALTGAGSEAVAVELMKHDAQDYLVKGEMTRDVLRRAIENAVEKVALQRQVRAQQEELRMFVNTVAHDLHAPMRTVSTFCQLLEEKAKGHLKYEELELLDFIMESGRYMMQLIEALLHYARVGQSHASFSDVNLNEVVFVYRLRRQIDLARKLKRVAS